MEDRMPKYLPGQLSIGRVSSNQEDDYISLEIEDRMSGQKVLDAKIPMKEFAEALTGLSARPILYERITEEVFERFGKKHQTKTIRVPYDRNNHPDRAVFFAEMKEAVKPYETDGWKAEEYWFRSFNGHRYNHEDKTYGVVFSRYVDATPEEIQKKIVDPYHFLEG